MSTAPPVVQRPTPSDHAFVPDSGLSADDTAWLARLVEANDRIHVSVGGDIGGELPPAAEAAFRRLITYFAAGRGVMIEGVASLLTTQQVADILRVPRGTVLKLLGTGKLAAGPSHGDHPRVWLADLIDYQRRVAEAAWQSP